MRPEVVRALCRGCDRMVDAKVERRHENGMQVYSTSRCPECDTVLWLWRFDPDAPLWRPEKERGQMRLF